jgi:hypothetical protein
MTIIRTCILHIFPEKRTEPAVTPVTYQYKVQFLVIIAGVLMDWTITAMATLTVTTLVAVAMLYGKRHVSNCSLMT